MSALLILRLDQLATLAGPYYYCFYLFIFLSHVRRHPLPGGAGEQDERQRTWQLFSGEVSVRKESATQSRSEEAAGKSIGT